MSSTLRRVLGLRSACERADLQDTARAIASDHSSLKQLPVSKSPVLLRISYRLIHHSRYLITFRLLVLLIVRISRLYSNSLDLSVGDIGRLVRDIEDAVGIADCYPRSLITGYLSLRCGKSCEIIIGSMAPTRKVHAWCATEGLVPYEALPEHFMYQPLIRWELTH